MDGFESHEVLLLQSEINGNVSMLFEANRRGASDSVTNSSVLSNPADSQNISYLGLCGRDICPKGSA